MKKIGFSSLQSFINSIVFWLVQVVHMLCVCMCTIHQNAKLMIICGKIAEQSTEDDIPLKEYSHCLVRIICNPPLYFRICSWCPGVLSLKEHLYKLMDSNLVEAVQYIHTNNGIILTDHGDYQKISWWIVETWTFCEHLKALLTHSFVAKQQSASRWR